MKYAFLFIMIFGIATVLYGLLIAATGDIDLIPYRRRYVAKMNDKKAYVKQIGRFTAIIGCSPLISGAVGALTENAIAGLIVFVGTLVAGIVFCVKNYKVL